LIVVTGFIYIDENAPNKAVSVYFG